MKNADDLARSHTENAISTLAEVMNDPFAENKDRVKAADSLLDRGHGKPSQAIIAIPASKRQQELLASMSDEDLLRAIQGARLPRLAPIIDATVVSVQPEKHKTIDEDKDSLLE
jgi:hypothetical protein